MTKQNFHDQGTNYIVDLTLDEKTIVKRNPQIEHERAVAIFDLLQFNRFKLENGPDGPYKVKITLQEGSLLLTIYNEDDDLLHQFLLRLTSFKRLIKDYFEMYTSYFEAIKTLTPAQIETIDMARRAMHDEGAVLLQDRLKGKISCDKMTARRLFTLICVLHVTVITV